MTAQVQAYTGELELTNVAFVSLSSFSILNVCNNRAMSNSCLVSEAGFLCIIDLAGLELTDSPTSAPKCWD